MKEEYNSLIKNQTWTLVNRPSGRKPIDCKWIFKTKRNTDGSVHKYKARLVARGFSQRKGIDYKDTYSPVARLDSIRLLLSIVTKEDMHMLHFDIKTAFLYGVINEDIYMEQPK